jgi:hypothetical protein
MAAAPRKTELGLAELEHRSLGLGLLQRRLLILVDGHRGPAELQQMMGRGEIIPLLDELVERGCVLWPGRTVGADTAPAAPAGGSTASPALETPVSGPERSPREVEMARNFMVNTLLTFIGPYADPELMKRLQAAQDSATLRELYGAWRLRMDSPRAAGKRMAELDAELKKVL